MFGCYFGAFFILLLAILATLVDYYAGNTITNAKHYWLPFGVALVFFIVGNVLEIHKEKQGGK